MVNADVGVEGSSEEGGQPMPSSADEAMFLAEQGEAGETPVSATPPKSIEVEDEKSELPPMDDLIKRIPAAARDALEEFFRARFVAVKRIPKSALKNN